MSELDGRYEPAYAGSWASANAPTYGDALAHTRAVTTIDNAIDDVKALPPSREVSLAITKLQEALFWLQVVS